MKNPFSIYDFLGYLFPGALAMSMIVYFCKGEIDIVKFLDECSLGEQTTEGGNPFYNVYTSNGSRLSNYVKVFKSNYHSSKYVYDDIKENIEQLIEDAIDAAGTY